MYECINITGLLGLVGLFRGYEVTSQYGLLWVIKGLLGLSVGVSNRPSVKGYYHN